MPTTAQKSNRSSHRGQRTVDRLLEIAIDLYGRPVSEGQDLRQEHAGDALLRIKPVVGIEDPRPGQAAGAAAVGPRLGVDHVSQPPAARDAGKEMDVVRTGRRWGLPDTSRDVANLVLVHQRDGFRLQQLTAAEPSLVHQRLQENY